MSRRTHMPIRSKLIALEMLLISSLVATSAGAAIVGTYVDADPTGRSPTTSPASAFPTSFTYSGDYGDGKWDVRTGLGNSNTVIEAGGNTENPPLITTTVTGLPLDSYHVYVLFGSTTTADWSIRAALSG